MASTKIEPCSACGRTRLVWARRDGRPLCKRCLALATAEPCSACGRTLPVVHRAPDGAPMCDTCRDHAVPSRLMVRYRRNAARRGLGWRLSLDRFACLVGQPCMWCGGKGGGVDRVDNERGYDDANCVPCCTMCNRMRSNFTVDAFLNKIEQIAGRM